MEAALSLFRRVGRVKATAAGRGRTTSDEDQQ